MKNLIKNRFLIKICILLLISGSIALLSFFVYRKIRIDGCVDRIFAAGVSTKDRALSMCRVKYEARDCNTLKVYFGENCTLPKASTTSVDFSKQENDRNKERAACAEDVLKNYSSYFEDGCKQLSKIESYHHCNMPKSLLIKFKIPFDIFASPLYGSEEIVGFGEEYRYRQVLEKFCQSL